jgi:hypothetical protein
MSAQSVQWELVELQARGKKEERVASLAPFYRRGYIYHNPDRCGVLEQQLLEFPRPSKWDVMDAAGYLAEMLDKGFMYFAPKEGDDVANMDDTYKELRRQDKTSPSGWRILDEPGGYDF